MLVAVQSAVCMLAGWVLQESPLVCYFQDHTSEVSWKNIFSGM